MFLQRINKKIAIVFALLILHQAIFPNVAFALTGGPSQPEVESFKPIGATDMVDLFTGDFSYNIPLMDVDGYPINISYQSNPGMDEEASWVGLGWTLNPGVMNREVRGFPDDFKGDTIKRQFNTKPNITTGGATGVKTELFGFFKARAGNGFFYNTYKGYGKESFISPSFAIGDVNKPFEIGLSYNNNTQSGLDIDLSVSKSTDKNQFNLFAGVNSRTGLKDLALSSHFGRGVIKLPLEGAISFAQRTYFPAAELPYINRSFAFDGTLGGEVSPVFLGYNFQGYYSIQELAYKSRTDRSFGYLYLQDGRAASTEPTALMDYNQEKVRPYRKDMPHIAIPYGTYDLYAASGQGVSGQFRATRNDVGTFGGQKRTNLSNSTSAGAEIGFGQDFRAGANVRVVKSIGIGQEWKSLNKVKDSLSYTNSNRNYEAVFFKHVGENVPTEYTFFNNIGAEYAAKVGITPAGPGVSTALRFEKEKNKQTQGNVPILAKLKRNTREKRNQVFSYLTAKEAAAVGLSKQIYSHPFNTLTYPSPGGSVVSINRTGGMYQDHHISEISVTQGDGSRYVYGIPAYNKIHREVTFSVHKDSAKLDPSQPTYGLVGYTAGADNSVSNAKGRDNYFDKQQLPPYAYAHLLTAVLSPDYVDRTGDGITEDDPGNAVKINYTKVRDSIPWRIPTAFRANLAKYHEGRKTDPGDDKGTYLYGKKEIWNVHSIESRTMIAQFYTTIANRNDARGVSQADENGAPGSTFDRPRRLDSIRLYSKADLRLNGTNAVPIKTVVFKYFPNDPLCKKVPNNTNTNNGKLTLEQIIFKYQKSGKGVLNPYKFIYSSVNPDYNAGKYDRWGSYQENPSTYPSNLDFPYTIQNPALLSPSAWNLTEITLPSGAKINVEYEPDDYAYVQDKRAHKMSFIQGFSRDSSGVVTTPRRALYRDINGNHEIYDYVVVSTDQINISTYTDLQIKKQFIDSLNNIYFDAQVTLNGNNNERIRGYMELDKSRLPKKLNGGLSLAIPVKKVTASKGKVTHPIALAAFQTMRLELQDITYGTPLNLDANNPSRAQMTKTLRQLLSRQQGTELKALLSGFERTAMNKSWAQFADIGETTANRSWVRLPDPDYIKYGGGSRVKKVTINDQWNIAQGGGASTYGQEYSYRMTESGITNPISSGVAAYEPTLGGEENALREPLPYKEKIKLAPSNYYYTETPVGESLFPAPVVGYRQVTVKNLVNPNVSRTATGSSVVKFYTAKEFPVLTDFTNNRPHNIKLGALSRFFRLNVVDYVTVSQGFLVEVNDMHGKMREEAVYNESGGLIRSTRYEYKVDDPKAERLHLNNLVNVVYPSGSIGTSLMGLDFDVWQDMQEDVHSTDGVGLSVNFDAKIPLITSFTAIPTLHREYTRLRTAATTKYIKRYGILDKVIVNENGSVASTRNVLFDNETGHVLLTETQNEFNDNVYAFNYPAHWAYPGMGQAYKNIGAIAKNIQIANGVISGLSNPQEVITEGDELIILRSNGTFDPQKYYVVACSAINKIMDANGSLANFGVENLTISVIRSGRRNLVAASIGSVESLVNPAASTQLTYNNQSKVINASAVTFNDVWSMFCENHPNYAGLYKTTNSINPFANGRKGNWRPNSNYIFFTDRDQTISTASFNRSNGTINNFVPFWAYNTTNQRWLSSANTPWTTAKEITMYDFRGNTIETKNPISVYASSQYGYNHTRVTAIADNARYREMAYEGFEDYNFNHTNSVYGNLTKPDQGALKKVLFGYNPLAGLYQNIVLDSINAHTGKYSIKVPSASESTTKIGQSTVICQVPNASTVSSFTAVEQEALSPDCPSLDFNCNDCLPKTTLGTSSNTEYLISAWVATSSTVLNGGLIPDNIGIEVVRINSTNQTTLSTDPLYKPKGPVVDGWQRIEFPITIPSGQDVLIKLKNGSGVSCYFDDFRFHPFKSNMKSFVYDNYTMRLIAELDENNYAMFYEYDDEGRLIRVKKETEKGVMTVKEARTNLKAN